jgi:hypothetical protein
MNGSELIEKARNLTRRLLSERKLEKLAETVHNIEKLDDISKLTRPLKVGS